MNDDNSIYEFEGKSYVSPTVARDEQTSFIDTLRQTGTENISRINQDTQNLGSQVDPMYGGFTEGTTFEERYATPQTENIVAGLQAAAQQSALSQALTNLQNQWSERYKEAYRNAKIREYNESNTGKTSGTGGTTDGANIDTEVIPESEQVSISDTEINVPGQSSSSWVDQQTIDTATSTSAVAGGTSPYNVAGYPYYYVDKDGNATGVRMYSDGGAETATSSYTPTGWSNYISSVISSGGKLYNSSGKDVSSTWRLLI